MRHLTPLFIIAMVLAFSTTNVFAQFSDESYEIEMSYEIDISLPPEDKVECFCLQDDYGNLRRSCFVDVVAVQDSEDQQEVTMCANDAGERYSMNDLNGWTRLAEGEGRCHPCKKEEPDLWHYQPGRPAYQSGRSASQSPAPLDSDTGPDSNMDE